MGPWAGVATPMGAQPVPVSCQPEMSRVGDAGIEGWERRDGGLGMEGRRDEPGQGCVVVG